MGRKYNSLKDALLFLLEEEKVLEAAPQLYKKHLGKLDSEIKALKDQNTDLDKKKAIKDERAARAKELFSKTKNEIDDFDVEGVYSDFIIQGYGEDDAYQMVQSKRNLLTVKARKAYEIIKMITQSLPLLLSKLSSVEESYICALQMKKEILQEFLKATNLRKEVSTLLLVTEDISLIADVNFKEKFKGHQHLFDAAFNDLLDTNSLAWIYKFSKKNNESLSKENMSKLATNVIETNIPAYMYLVAVKIDNIPDEDMKRLIAAIVASNDKKYINCLLLDLHKKGVSEGVRSFISSLGIFINSENQELDLADELEQALLEDDYETLYKHGMYSYEDRSYKLANVWAGL